MNIERFHNELAMRLGYERIVKDKRILISVEESEEPLVTLKIMQGYKKHLDANCDVEAENNWHNKEFVSIGKDAGVAYFLNKY